jgi:Uma2 family endonuclease
LQKTKNTYIFAINFSKMTVLTAPKPLSEKKRANKLYSLEEYLHREENAMFKSEFYNGQIIPIRGGKSTHNLIANNISTALRYEIKRNKLKYITFNSDQKIYIPNKEIAVYPDALVISEKPEYWKERKDLITNPILIVEVLSKSTRGYDKGEKFIHYRTLPSFKEYVLIEQDEKKVELWFRSKENTWEITTVEGIDAVIFLNSIGVSVSMSDIYENIEEL